MFSHVESLFFWLSMTSWLSLSLAETFGNEVGGHAKCAGWSWLPWSTVQNRSGWRSNGQGMWTCVKNRCRVHVTVVRLFPWIYEFLYKQKVASERKVKEMSTVVYNYIHLKVWSAEAFASTLCCQKRRTSGWPRHDQIARFPRWGPGPLPA